MNEENARRLDHYRTALKNWLLRKATGKPTQPDPKPEPPFSMGMLINSADGVAELFEGPRFPDESPAETVPIVAELGQAHPSKPDTYSRGPNDTAPLAYRVTNPPGYPAGTYEKQLLPWGPWSKAEFYVRVA